MDTLSLIKELQSSYHQRISVHDTDLPAEEVNDLVALLANKSAECENAVSARKISEDALENCAAKYNDLITQLVSEPAKAPELARTLEKVQLDVTKPHQDEAYNPSLVSQGDQLGREHSDTPTMFQEDGSHALHSALKKYSHALKSALEESLDIPKNALEKRSIELKTARESDSSLRRPENEPTGAFDRSGAQDYNSPNEAIGGSVEGALPSQSRLYESSIQNLLDKPAGVHKSDEPTGGQIQAVENPLQARLMELTKTNADLTAALGKERAQHIDENRALSERIEKMEGQIEHAKNIMVCQDEQCEQLEDLLKDAITRQENMAPELGVSRAVCAEHEKHVKDLLECIEGYVKVEREQRDLIEGYAKIEREQREVMDEQHDAICKWNALFLHEEEKQEGGEESVEADKVKDKEQEKEDEGEEEV